MTPFDTDSPDGIPADVAEFLEGSSDRQLRAAIQYAQQLLDEHPPLMDAIEARPGETLVRVEEHDVYTTDIVERPDEIGEACGPFAYRVEWAPAIDGGEGEHRWHYLGTVHGESGGG